MDTPDDPSLTLWTFADAEGRSHVALPLLQVEREGERYSLALTSGSGLVALRHLGDSMEPVTDPALVARLADHLHALQAQRTRPVVIFEAPGPQGPATRYFARGLVAHLGQGYLVAADGAGSERVFLAPAGPGDVPRPLDDEALAAAVLRIAAREQARARAPEDGALSSEGPPARAHPRVQLTFPGGEQRTLECVRRVALEGAAYQMALDLAEPGRVYALREERGGALTPVDDPALIARVRAAILEEG